MKWTVKARLGWMCLQRLKMGKAAPRMGGQGCEFKESSRNPVVWR